MALEVFSSVRYYLSPEEISIDNWIFKLHYKFSTAIWLGSSAIGVAKQYFGDPINCQVFTNVIFWFIFQHFFFTIYVSQATKFK
jgi:hypothetical protein